MSAMLSFPERPAPARWKGGRRRSGHGVTSTVTSLKFDERPALRIGSNSSRGGTERSCFVTGKGAMILSS